MYRVLLTIKMLAGRDTSVPPSYLCCNRHDRACPQSCSQKSHLLAGDPRTPTRGNPVQIRAISWQETHGRPQGAPLL